MDNRFIVVVNGSWTIVVEADTVFEAQHKGCNEWRRLFADGEDLGGIVDVHTRRLRVDDSWTTHE